MAALLALVCFLNIIPVLALSRQPGFSWKESPLVLNAYGNGAVYYDARIREVKDGFPLLGNPWFLEHNQKIAPAFLAADWLQALPLIFGASFEFTLVFGLLFWSFVFVFLAYLILMELINSRGVSVAGAALSYFSVYSLMLGPVSMQIVFPFLLFFLLAFLLWLKDHNSSPKMIFLIIASACSFYIYTYLWQAALTVLLLTLIFLLFIKKWKQAVNLLAVIALSVALAIPLIIFTFKQVAQPDYWETMTRIGFIFTRWPAAEAYYSGRWIFVMLILWALLWRWIKPLRHYDNYLRAFTFFALSGIGFEIVSLSNVLTGKELELAGHMVRFITVWLMLAFTAILFFAWQGRAELKNLKPLQKIICIFLLIISFWGVWQYARPYFSMVRIMAADSSAQNIANLSRPLEWLENNVSEPAVVWANYQERINSYVPILTKHYVLFDGDGVLNFISNDEAEERYLTAGYMNNLTQKDIEREYSLYAGIGNGIHPYKIHNRKVKLCRLLYLNKIGYNCGELTDATLLKGKEYFSNLYQRYIREVKPNINAELQKFRVAYIVKDKNKIVDFKPENFDGATLVYQDQFFLIYHLNQ
ncbi:MAG: hypothetical protein Q8O93_03610 [bacterium]|nr:hypothetical protein [bacterium]